jgi:hypothetical protein
MPAGLHGEEKNGGGLSRGFFLSLLAYASATIGSWYTTDSSCSPAGRVVFSVLIVRILNTEFTMPAGLHGGEKNGGSLKARIFPFSSNVRVSHDWFVVHHRLFV